MTKLTKCKCGCGFLFYAKVLRGPKRIYVDDRHKEIAWALRALDAIRGVRKKNKTLRLTNKK